MYEQHVIIDLEMNPVSSKYGAIRKVLRNEVIEIGAVKLDQDYKVVDRFECLVKPQYNAEITAFITNLTGINNGAVKRAYLFANAMEELTSWIGEKKTRIYSWSDTDLRQLREECKYKDVQFPINMSRWIDFQMVYPRLMGLSSNNKMSLKDAADWHGVFIDTRKAHRALYDSEVTSELVISVLTGQYKVQKEILHISRRDTTAESGVTLGDLYKDFFAQFQIPGNNEVEYVR